MKLETVTPAVLLDFVPTCHAMYRYVFLDQQHVQVNKRSPLQIFLSPFCMIHKPLELMMQTKSLDMARQVCL